MSIFGFEQTTAIAAWGSLTYLQISQVVNSMQTTKKYNEENKDGPPSWVFPIVWAVLYAGLTAAMFYFTQTSTPDSWQLIVGVIAYMVHIVANKLWSVYFWDYENPLYAMMLLCYVMLPSLALLILCVCIDQAHKALFYVPLIPLGVYALWLFYAMYLNSKWIKA